MANNSIAKVKKIKKLMSEIIKNRWNGTEIKDAGDYLIYDIQHKKEKVSYTAAFEVKDDIVEIIFRATPYEKDELLVDPEYADTIRFDYINNYRSGITNMSLEFEDTDVSYAAIPTTHFRYWMRLDVGDDTLKETLKPLLEIIVPGDCVQLISFLRSNPEYLA